MTDANEQKSNESEDDAAPQQESASAVFPVVGIGASAGGLEALQTLFEHIPEHTGMAFVVVSHQPEGHSSVLPDILARHASIPVLPADDGIEVQPDHAYVMTPDGQLSIEGGILRRVSAPAQGRHLPIDHFLRALATDRGHGAIAVILSGTGSDGSLGLSEVKASGGLTLVQKAATAAYTGMPSSALATDQVDAELAPERMPSKLMAYTSSPLIGKDGEGPLVADDVLERIFTLLRERTGNVFDAYKKPTASRRVLRRMALHNLRDPWAYLEILSEQPAEVQALFRDLLISVTGFFRDPEAAEALTQQGLRKRVENAAETGESIRIWVPGCATGEEAYGLAIMVREIIERLDHKPDVQIFGTDLDPVAIDVARAGTYSQGIEHDVSRQRLERFFSPHEGTYKISKTIRDMVIFAIQNVITDPPFTNVDLVACRNVLIYLRGEVQQRVLKLFHYALKPKGLLFLGPSETLGGMEQGFEALDVRWRIFQRTGETLRTENPPLSLPLPASSTRASARTAGARVGAAHTQGGAHFERLVERQLLWRYAPPSAITDRNGAIHYIHGRTGRFLEPASGRAQLNIIKMARGGLEQQVPFALREAAARDTVIQRSDISVRANGDATLADITVIPLHQPESLSGLFLISFTETTRSEQAAASEFELDGEASAEQNRIAELEHALRSSKESLQMAVEELEISNEDLKSTNEELQSTNEELESTNEELQSANEELKTSRGEMESLNSEITNVNADLRTKVGELSSVEDDIDNILNASWTAAIVLDPQFKIVRYTERARLLANLIDSDSGRPLSDLAFNLRYDNLMADCREVLDTLVYKEQDVCSSQDIWYRLRIAPYRTGDDRIEGVVVVFTNIDASKRAELESERGARELLAALLPHCVERAMVIDAEARVLAVNAGFRRAFTAPHEQVVGSSLYAIGDGAWDSPLVRAVLRRALSTDAASVIREEVDLPGHAGLELRVRSLGNIPGEMHVVLIEAPEHAPAGAEAPQKPSPS